MPESTCSQKGICALAPEHGIFGQEELDVSVDGADAMEQVGWTACLGYGFDLACYILQILGTSPCCI